MVAPTNREALKNYCLRELGHPVIEINVDNDQLEDRIDEAFQYWQDWHYDATTKTYISYPLTQTDITNKYITIADSVIRVTNIFPVGSGGTSASGNFFDMNYQMRLTDMYNMQSQGLTYYTMAKTNLEMMDMLLNGKIPVRYNRHADKLFIDWDWTVDAKVGQFIIIEAYAIIDPSVYSQVYNDFMLKRHLTALFKRQWGANLSKFAGIQLPGGVTLNGVEIFQQGDKEVKEVELDIREMYSEPPRMAIG